jgi:hypothetical protein
LISVTVTPGIEVPVASVTVPVIEDMDCAKLSVEHASNTKNEKIFFMA